MISSKKYFPPTNYKHSPFPPKVKPLHLFKVTKTPLESTLGQAGKSITGGIIVGNRRPYRRFPTASERRELADSL